MGSLPQLAEAIAYADGIADTSILKSAGRRFREDGLLTQSLRGRGANRMTLTDARNLLIATALPVARENRVAGTATFCAVPRFSKVKLKRASALFQLVQRGDNIGAALDNLIEGALSLPPEIRIKFMFSPRMLQMIVGARGIVIVEYLGTGRIGMNPGGDRTMQVTVDFTTDTLRGLHHAIY
jgi:hypothetical protein